MDKINNHVKLLIVGIVITILGVVLDQSRIVDSEFCVFFIVLGVVAIIASGFFYRLEKSAEKEKDKPKTTSEAAPDIFTQTQIAYAFGQVASGDYAGCTVWKMTDNEYVVVRGAQTSYKIGYLGCDFGTLSQLANFLKLRQECSLTTETIEKIVEASSYTSGPDARAFIDGALTAGVGYGMAKAMNSAYSRASVAVYLKDGKKMMIEFFSIENARIFQNNLFIF